MLFSVEGGRRGPHVCKIPITNQFFLSRVSVVFLFGVVCETTAVFFLWRGKGCPIILTVGLLSQTSQHLMVGQFQLIGGYLLSSLSTPSTPK